MSKKTQLEQLEQECHTRGVKLIYDDLRSEGGLCRLRGSFYLILNRRLAAETKARIIGDGLTRVQERARTMTELPDNSDRVPGVTSTPSPAELPPVVEAQPMPAYEEAEVGVPLAVGVRESQS